jgi:hypothetical protein
MSIDDSLPTDLASAHALIIAQREALNAAETRAAAAESDAKNHALLIEKLKGDLLPWNWRTERRAAA